MCLLLGFTIRVRPVWHKIVPSLQIYKHISATRMSSRRSRQGASYSRITDDQIIELVSKLKQLLPEIRSSRSNKVWFCFVLLLTNVTPLLSIYALKINTDILLVVSSILFVWVDYIYPAPCTQHIGHSIQKINQTVPTH